MNYLSALPVVCGVSTKDVDQRHSSDFESLDRADRIGFTVGDLSDGLSEYAAGERLAIQMNQFFNALGRPKEFEQPVQAVWASYENAKAGWFMGKVGQWHNATPMKQVGIDAAKVTADMQKAYPNQAATVPSGNIPKPESDGPLSVVTKYIPWIIGGVAVLGAGIYVVPLVTPMIMAKMVRQKATA